MGIYSYNMRITDRNHIPKLIAVLFPAGNRLERDNGCVEDCEVGLLMWFYWTSFPHHIFTMQKLFGREYSQISRVLKAIWNDLNARWGHLVTNNIPFFVPRFQECNRLFLGKYTQLHGHAW